MIEYLSKENVVSGGAVVGQICHISAMGVTGKNCWRAYGTKDDGPLGGPRNTDPEFKNPSLFWAGSRGGLLKKVRNICPDAEILAQ